MRSLGRSMLNSNRYKKMTTKTSKKTNTNLAEISRGLADMGARVERLEKRGVGITRWDVFRALVVLAFVALAIGNTFLLIGEWEARSIGPDSGIEDLLIIYPLIAEYILIGGIFVSLAAVRKRGFSNLRSHGVGGLTAGLIAGLTDDSRKNFKETEK